MTIENLKLIATAMLWLTCIIGLLAIMFGIVSGFIDSLRAKKNKKEIADKLFELLENSVKEEKKEKSQK